MEEWLEESLKKLLELFCDKIIKVTSWDIHAGIPGKIFREILGRNSREIFEEILEKNLKELRVIFLEETV